MKTTYVTMSLAIGLGGCFGAQAAITCPPMPSAVTEVNRDWNSDITGSIVALGKVKAGELQVKTEVTAKNLFAKYPNVDRLLALQTMSATYCEMLRASTLTDKERLDRWEVFQLKVLSLADAPKAKQPSNRSSEIQVPHAPARAPMPTPYAEPNTAVPTINNGANAVVTGSNNVINQSVAPQVDQTVLQSSLNEAKAARVAAAQAESPTRFPEDWQMAEQLLARGAQLLAASDSGAKDVLQTATARYRNMESRATFETHVQDMQARTARDQRLRVASEAASYAQKRATAKKHKTVQERELYAAARAKLDDARHQGQTGGDEEAVLKAYKEAQDLWERIADGQ